MTEAEFQRRVTDMCDWLGIRWHHEVDSRKSKKGFPDLVLVGNRVLFVELKSQRGRISKDQENWIEDLWNAGAPVYVWRPDDWPTIQETLRDLAPRRVRV